jgi:hypothetical protein
MKPENNDWTKEELQIYILMLCANADSNETKNGLKLIKSKSDKKTFRKIYEEFSKDSEEEESLKKIDSAIHNHEYSQMELSKFHKDIRSIFFSDNTFSNMERNLDRTLNNIIY